MPFSLSLGPPSPSLESPLGGLFLPSLHSLIGVRGRPGGSLKSVRGPPPRPAGFVMHSSSSVSPFSLSLSLSSLAGFLSNQPFFSLPLRNYQPPNFRVFLTFWRRLRIEYSGRFHRRGDDVLWPVACPSSLRTSLSLPPPPLPPKMMSFPSGYPPPISILSSLFWL